MAWRFLLSITGLCSAIVLLWSPVLMADTYPPAWGTGTVNVVNGPIHFAPAAWPSEPADPLSCGNTCGDWKPYTRFQSPAVDPRTQDPSNGGTRPQNYVNIASSCVDKTFPSIYYNLYKHPTDPTKDVIFFRWRVEQIANNYATGPSAGSYSATDPWSSALWTVLFNIDGSGYRTLAAHLDGSSGAPATPIDRIFGIWGNVPTQSIDYTTDPNIHLLGHNPTAFTGPTDKIMNFQNSATPTESWPNGEGETLWDYGTTRARVVSNNSCNEYFIDYQIPVAMLDASPLGGPKITRSTPISMLFCSSNSLNNPFQKDCAVNKIWAADPSQPAPFGDFLSFDQTTPYSQPIISQVTATQPSSCPGSGVILTAKVQDTLAVVNGVVVPSVKWVKFYYYFDADGNGYADDGSTWILAANGTLDPGTLNSYTAQWDASALLRGKYLIGVQALDSQYIVVSDNNVYNAGTDISLLDDDLTPTEARNRTISYLDQASVNDALVFALANDVPAPTNETWYANPGVTGLQTAMVGTSLNACGVAPSITKSVSASTVTAGGTVDFTITVSNPAGMLAPLLVSQLSDILPPGFTFASNQGGTLSPTGLPTAGASGTVSWTFSPAASISAGSSGTLIFRATASSATGTYTNIANATTTLPGYTTLTSNPVTVAVGAPRLTIAKTANAASYNPGDTITYTITYSNDSPVNVTNVQITDPIATGLSYKAGSLTVRGVAKTDANDSDSAHYDSGVPRVVFNLGALMSGEGPYTVSFQVTVNNPYPDAAPIPSVNTATITSTETAGATASSSSFINAPRPNMVILKDANVWTVGSGGNVIFTINYANTGNASASNVYITDTTPTGFTYQASSLTPFSAPAVGGTGLIRWNIGTVAANATGFFTVTMQATASAVNPTVNTTIVNWDTAKTATDSFTVGITGGACTATNYFFHDTDSTSPGTANTTGASGTRQTYSVTMPSATPLQIAVFNDNTTHASPLNLSTVNASIYVTHPAKNLTFTVELYDNSVAPANLMMSGTAGSSGNKTDTLISVPLTGSNSVLPANHVLVWRVLVNDGGNGQPYTVSMVADINIGPAAPASPDLWSSGSSFCQAAYQMEIDKQVDKLSALAGNNLVYTIKYANTSTAAIAGATITDATPTGTTYVSATGSPSTAPASGGTGNVIWSIGSIAAGASGSVTMTVNVNSPLDSSVNEVANTATLATTSFPTTYSDTATTKILKPNVSITKSADKTLLNPTTGNDTVTFTITAINSGSGSASNVLISDTLPDESYFSYVTGSTKLNGSSIADSLTVNGGNNNDSLSYNLGTLAAGASATLSFQMKVISGAPNGVTIKSNSATVSDSATSGTRSSNTVDVSISTNPNLRLTKAASAPVLPATDFKPGDKITYTLTLTNIGSGAATSVVVTDPIPANMTYSAQLATLTAAASSASTLSVSSTTPFTVNQSVIVNGTTTQVTSIGVGTIGVSPAVTAAIGSDIFSTCTFDGINNQMLCSEASLAAGATQIWAFAATVNALASGSYTLTNTGTATAANASSRTATATSPASASPTLVTSKSGPTTVSYPATTLSAAAAATTTLFVSSSAQFTSGQYVKIGAGAIYRQITAISGNTITVDAAVTANLNDPVYGSITYSILYRNTGTAAATSAVVTDIIPAGLGYYTSLPAATTAPAVGSSGNATWNIGTLAAGGSGTVSVTVFPTASGTVTNTAKLTSTEVPICIVACPSTVNTDIGGLIVTKSTTTPTRTAGSAATYIIEITNTLGAGSATGVSITDTLPSGFTYASPTSVLINGSPVVPATTPSVGDNALTWNSFTIPAGQKLVLTFVADIGASVGAATYQNPASATSTNTSVIPFDPLGTTAEDVTVLAANTGEINGYVYKDLNNNGVFDPLVDIALAGVEVNITDRTGTLYTLATDSSGYFSRVVASGNATVDIRDADIPGGYRLAFGSADPLTVVVPNGSSVTKNTGYTNSSIPLAVNDGVYNVPFQTTSTGSNADIRANDTGASLVVAGVTGTGATCISFDCTVTTIHGSVTVKADGTFIYTPSNGYVGPDYFTYYVNDGSNNSNTATVRFNVQAPAVPPLAINDSASTNYGVPVVLPILNNDAGGISSGAATTLDPATIDLDPATAGQQTTYTVVGEGTFTVDTGTGLVTFTPVAGFYGVVSIPYIVKDSASQTSNTALITVTVAAPDPGNPVPPKANNDSAITTINTPVTLATLANDGAGLTSGGAATTLDPATVDLNVTTGGIQSSITKPEGTWTVNVANGNVTFTPTNNYNASGQPFTGVATLLYTVTDNNSQTSNQATLSVTVTGGLTPVASPDVAVTKINTAVSLAILDNDKPSIGYNFDLTTVDLDTGTLGIQTTNTTSEGSWAVNSSGIVTFTPTTGYTGTTVALPYAVTDSNGKTATSSITVTVTPITVNAVNDSAVTKFNTAVTITVAANDSANPGATLNPTTVIFTSGSATNGGKDLTTAEGTWHVNGSGTVTFTPQSGYTGTTASVTYQISDSLGNTTTATITVTVAPLPTAVNDSGTTTVNTALTQSTTILSNDSGYGGITLGSVTGTSGVCSAFACTITTTHGGAVVQSNGTYVYTPAADYSGPDSFTYQITDSLGQTANATVNLTINPKAFNDTGTTWKNKPLDSTSVVPGQNVNNANILTNDKGTTVVLTSVTGTGPACGGVDFPCTITTRHGTAVVQSSGTHVYTPAAGYGGTDSFAYQITDASGGKVTAIVNLTITVPPTRLCDVIIDSKNEININDINQIFADRDKAVTICTGGDLDCDGIMSINDARGCVLRCQNAKCAVTP